MTVARRAVGLLLDAAAVAAAAVLHPLGVRFLQIRAPRIGEVGASLGYFVESGALGWRPKVRGIFLTFPDQRRISNPSYFGYWQRYVRVIKNRLLYRLAFRVAERPGMYYPTRNVRLPDGSIVHVDRALVASHPRWARAHDEPLLVLSPDHERRGRAVLRSLGVEDGDWFVAVHAREGAYFREGDDSPARHRNAAIETYLPAMQRIVEQGGWVVRVGDPTMTPLAPLERVIDYPHTPHYSDWMDVYLSASCRFFLGCSSGLFVVAWSFGRPVALANWNSLLTRPWGKDDVFIPKLWWSEPEQRFLRFSEAIGPLYDRRAFSETSHADEFERVGLRLVDSTAEEIVELVEEMFSREAGEPYSDDDERRQEEFNSLSAHYGYGVASRIGSAFLAEHADLLRLDPGDAER